MGGFRVREVRVREVSLYTGFCVLDLSKLLMYDFHYNYIKQKYPGEKSTLCFTDTDSLLYAIKTENIYRDMMCVLTDFILVGTTMHIPVSRACTVILCRKLSVKIIK